MSEYLCECWKDPKCLHGCYHSDDLTQAADALAKAASMTDNRCLKYGVLPNKKTCGDIASWVGENDLSCLNCKLIKALSAYEKARGLK